VRISASVYLSDAMALCVVVFCTLLDHCFPSYICCRNMAHHHDPGVQKDKLNSHIRCAFGVLLSVNTAKLSCFAGDQVASPSAASQAVAAVPHLVRHGTAFLTIARRLRQHGGGLRFP
jgi:hypothetical protein